MSNNIEIVVPDLGKWPRMSFLFRFLFVVGLIYAISPVHPGLPGWIEKTVTAATQSNSVEVGPNQTQSIMNLTVAACKSDPSACARAVQVTASIGQSAVALNDHMIHSTEVVQDSAHSYTNVPAEPEATGLIAERIPLPPRRNPETDPSKKI